MKEKGLSSECCVTYIQKEDFGFYNEKHQFFERQENKIANTCEIQKHRKPSLSIKAHIVMCVTEQIIVCLYS